MPAAEAAALFHSLADEPLLALAVSGGSDSMAMLHLAVEVFAPSRLIALTVDHGLRDGSAAEAETVSRWCAALGVAHHTLRWDGEKPRTGIQAKGRVARYGLMAARCRELDINVLLTAHTRDDQAETVAMRKQRTGSLRSLAGIWPETPWDGVRICRPLLGENRGRLRDYLVAKDVRWIEDPSNVNPAFERVRVRQGLPANDHASLAGEALAAMTHMTAVRAEAARWLAANAQLEPVGLLRFPRDGFRVLPADVALEALDVAIRMVGSGRAPERSTLLSAAALVQGNAAGRLTLAGAIMACRNREVLLGREPGRIDPEPVPVPPGGSLLWDGRFLISGPEGTLVRPMGVHCPKRQKDLPAFVLAGLPWLEFPDGTRLSPHLEQHPEITVMLAGRLSQNPAFTIQTSLELHNKHPMLPSKLWTPAGRGPAP
ncbi:MAG: tRNA lysidine(34) synthetase TilS [Proteobacteria bacterium]|nr:tRNA lysidine(34) synthetase TilS [Pseudomonadota bacterium]